MAYVRKTIDIYEVCSNYGYGWEVECEGENKQDAQRLLKEYQKNSYGVYKIRHRRISKQGR